MNKQENLDKLLDNFSIEDKKVYLDEEVKELYIALKFKKEQKNLLLIVSQVENIELLISKIKGNLEFLGCHDYLIHKYLMPFEDPYLNNAYNYETLIERYKIIKALENQKPLIIITTLASLALPLEEREIFSPINLQIKVGEEKEIAVLKKELLAMGYKEREYGLLKSSFLINGNFMEVLSPDRENGLRLEVKDGKIFSLRGFDLNSQKNISTLKECSLMAAHFFHQSGKIQKFSCSIDSKETLSLQSLMEDYCSISFDYSSLREEYEKLMDYFSQLKQRVESDKHILDTEELFPLPNIEDSNVDLRFNSKDEDKIISYKDITLLDLKQAYVKLVNELVNQGYKLIIAAVHSDLQTKMKNVFEDFLFIQKELPQSFVLHREKLFFLTYREGFCLQEQAEENALKDTSPEISEGDLLVHNTHGIGKFVGFQEIKQNNGEIIEFLRLEYKDKEFLLLPVSQLDVVSKYQSMGDLNVNLDKLGGQSWEKKKSRAKKNIITFAKELLDLYSARKTLKGKSFKEVKDERLFEKSFPFIETPDQRKAINDVLNDLKAPYPMDRLICGDVSFGKTEVALRAAFRVAGAGCQVLILCPTTVLALQHSKNFKRRFEGYGYKTVMLSRLVKLKEKKEILSDIESGEAQIIIGTHLLLGKNINYKNLGLIIVDEEQRFGVFQKEKLKKGRENIDVLYLSATPIPRTLSLHLAGLQDCSIITTPPLGRQAVKNFIAPLSRELIISALMKERERAGQSYVIINNIDRIYEFRDYLSSWLPGLSIAVVHGRMSSEEIETKLLSFMGGEIEVLLSTTLIENGIDIPDVNTMIIIDAQNFGLTQLYQLRGRIGRGKGQGYAYFLVSKDILSQEAEARIEAIREFSSLGSGYKIAQEDLKLRGGGALLGNKQHGHIEALGFDYYLKMLNNTVARLKGEEESHELSININFNYSINPFYIKSSAQRVALYKEIADTKDYLSLMTLREVILDRYGYIDESIEKIFYCSGLRVIASYYSFKHMEIFLDRVVVTLNPLLGKQAKSFKEFMDYFECEVLDPVTIEFEIKDYLNFFEEAVLFLDCGVKED